MENKFGFIYAGYIGTAQELDILIYEAKKLNEHNEILSPFVGDSHGKESLFEKAKEFE